MPQSFSDADIQQLRSTGVGYDARRKRNAVMLGELRPW